MYKTDTNTYYDNGFSYERKERGGGVYYTPLKYRGKYNSYGNLIDKPFSDIVKGDKVTYLTPKFIRDGNRYKTIKVLLYGSWDGEKVQFDDKEQTIVRARQWLNKITEEEFLKNYIHNR